jgi:3-deoxy-manno-octulosonate cytidylyltransferase (CMP-KDO synthetase)
MSATPNPKILAILPARYGSTRFPGKPLALIAGKSLIQRTYENVKSSRAVDQIVVATDDKRIFDHVVGFGGRVVMTSVDCPTGTDRLVEALRNAPDLEGYSFVINIQGDEPCVEPKAIRAVTEILTKNPEAVMSTAVVKLTNEAEAYDHSIVKCVFSSNGNALYFSRTLIPAGHKGKFDPKVGYFRHLGIYGFQRSFLMRYGQLPATSLQLAEDLEQLKVLEHGYCIKVAVVEDFSVGVNHPEDINKVEQYLCKQNTFSSREESAHP